MEPAAGERRIRQLLKDPDCVVTYPDHARKRMAERNVTAMQIRKVLAAGAVVEFQGDGKYPGGHRFLVRGYDEDGRALAVVVDIYMEEAKIDLVTVEKVR